MKKLRRKEEDNWKIKCRILQSNGFDSGINKLNDYLKESEPDKMGI